MAGRRSEAASDPLHGRRVERDLRPHDKRDAVPTQPSLSDRRRGEPSAACALPRGTPERMQRRVARRPGRRGRRRHALRRERTRARRPRPRGFVREKRRSPSLLFEPLERERRQTIEADARRDLGMDVVEICCDGRAHRPRRARSHVAKIARRRLQADGHPLERLPPSASTAGGNPAGRSAHAPPSGHEHFQRSIAFVGRLSQGARWRRRGDRLPTTAAITARPSGSQHGEPALPSTISVANAAEPPAHTSGRGTRPRRVRDSARRTPRSASRCAENRPGRGRETRATPPERPRRPPFDSHPAALGSIAMLPRCAARSREPRTSVAGLDRLIGERVGNEPAKARDPR